MERGNRKVGNEEKEKEKRKKVIDQEKSDIPTGMQGYENTTELSVSHDINDLIQPAFVCGELTLYEALCSMLRRNKNENEDACPYSMFFCTSKLKIK